jgi:Glycosyl hydrolases family 2, sugar binding domain/Glycosyl hydrolases family 2, TIM barrel domain/Glycosyl hydrolases family 2
MKTSNAGSSSVNNIQNRRQFLYAASCAVALPVALPAASRAAQSTSGDSHTKIFSLDGSDWLLSLDPGNNGGSRGWTKGPADGATAARVPWVIQDAFPNYHGVAWYWRQFQAPAHAQPGGRYLLRFHAVDYLGEVWVNGTRLGVHEGGEEPFELDATAAIRPDQTNQIAVRVLNPTHELIDGIRLEEVAEGRRDYPVPRDNAYNTGGITGSVELLLAPVVRIEDLYVIPDWKTGEIRIQANIRNAGGSAVRGLAAFQCAPASGAETIVSLASEQHLEPGDNAVQAVLRVPGHRLWELNDPFLYRVTARVQIPGSSAVDERSVRCGFRGFRFENGYFRLNGRRIRLHGALYTVLLYPISQSTPYDEDLLRRDMLNMKTLGFNSIRITCGAALPRQLDLLDELGLLACEEHFGAREMAPSPLLEERWDRSISGVVKRDRNHPSIVLWSLLNEVKDGRLFRHAVESLPLVRDLDESRIILVGSGRFDNDSRVGSLSNPGSREWELTDLRDVHAYPPFPHSAEDIRQMRSGNARLAFMGTFPPTSKNTDEKWQPMLLSEYGVCGAQDYPRFLRHFEQLGEEHAADAALFREKMDAFEVDWKKWRLDECWARPEDYFAESQSVQAKLALNDYNAWMANPALIGDFNSTQITDAWFHGCGITNFFRELKPGMADAFNDMAMPVRWCLFVDRVNAYPGAVLHLDAVLVNHDALKPGIYPVRFQVVGPKASRQLDITIQLEIPNAGSSEPPFARSVFTHDLVAAGPPGRYRFLATFERGAAAGGGEAEFYVGDKAGMPDVPAEVVLWGGDQKLATWLRDRGFRFRDSLSPAQTAREVIVVSGKAQTAGAPAAFSDLARRIARGSTGIFLTPETLLENAFTGEPQPLRWAPLESKMMPQLCHTPNWYFRADPWAKEHPVFAGLPSGGILDYTFYRDIITSTVFRGLEPPVETISGAIQTSGGPDDYDSDLTLAVCKFGAGRVILNSLKIRENLGTIPAAERLLRNLLNYGAQGIEQPIADPPAGFDDYLHRHFGS